jgi:hypothetical protein
LGLNLWIGLMGLPLWHLQTLGAMSTSAALVALAALLPLTIGVTLLASAAHSAAAALLIGVPVLLLAAIGIQPALVGPSVFSPAVAALVGSSFAAYVLGSCWAANRVQSLPLPHTAEDLDEGSPRKLRIWPWPLVVFGAVMTIQVIAQGHLSVASFPDESLGPLARWRTAILSAAALLIWVVAVFVILAPGLRHQAPAPLSPPSRGAAAVWLLVVALALALLGLSSIE